MSAILKQKLIDIANGFTKYNLWKGGGSSKLSELNDVNLTNLKTNDVLTYNGSVWVNDDNLQKQIDTLNSNFKSLLITKYYRINGDILANSNFTGSINIKIDGYIPFNIYISNASGYSGGNLIRTNMTETTLEYGFRNDTQNNVSIVRTFTITYILKSCISV